MFFFCFSPPPPLSPYTTGFKSFPPSPREKIFRFVKTPRNFHVVHICILKNADFPTAVAFNTFSQIPHGQNSRPITIETNTRVSNVWHNGGGGGRALSKTSGTRIIISPEFIIQKKKKIYKNVVMRQIMSNNIKFSTRAGIYLPNI